MNRELCDANDGLCAVLENSNEEAGKGCSLREANMACELIFPNSRQLVTDYQSPVDGQAPALTTPKLPEYLGELRRSRSVPCEANGPENRAQVSEQMEPAKLTATQGRRHVPLILASKHQQKSQDSCSLLAEPGLESFHEGAVRLVIPNTVVFPTCNVINWFSCIQVRKLREFIIYVSPDTVLQSNRLFLALHSRNPLKSYLGNLFCIHRKTDVFHQSFHMFTNR